MIMIPSSPALSKSYGSYPSSPSFLGRFSERFLLKQQNVLLNAHSLTSVTKFLCVNRTPVATEVIVSCSCLSLFQTKAIKFIGVELKSVGKMGIQQ